MCFQMPMEGKSALKRGMGYMAIFTIQDALHTNFQGIP